jgi:hypothetical protein
VLAESLGFLCEGFEFVEQWVTRLTHWFLQLGSTWLVLVPQQFRGLSVSVSFALVQGTGSVVQHRATDFL